MNKVIGFAWLINKPNTHIGEGTYDGFTGRSVPVVDRNKEGDVMLYVPHRLGSFHARDVIMYFDCSVVQGWVLPPTNTVGSIDYLLKAKAVGLDQKMFNAIVKTQSFLDGKYFMSIFEDIDIS